MSQHSAYIKAGPADWQLLTRWEHSITAAVLPANDLSHLLQRDVFQQHEDWSHLIGEPVCTEIAWPSYTSQKKYNDKQTSQKLFLNWCFRGFCNSLQVLQQCVTAISVRQWWKKTFSGKMCNFLTFISNTTNQTQLNFVLFPIKTIIVLWHCYYIINTLLLHCH